MVTLLGERNQIDVAFPNTVGTFASLVQTA
jgi:hypothetical protein